VPRPRARLYREEDGYLERGTRLQLKQRRTVVIPTPLTLNSDCLWYRGIKLKPFVYHCFPTSRNLPEISLAYRKCTIARSNMTSHLGP